MIPFCIVAYTFTKASEAESEVKVELEKREK